MIRITAHAILRFLERVKNVNVTEVRRSLGCNEQGVLDYLETTMGINVDLIKQEMIDGWVSKAIRVFKKCVIKKPEYCLVVKDYSVITVLEPKMKVT